MAINSLITSFPAELLHFVLDEYHPVYDAEKIEVNPARMSRVQKGTISYASQLQFFAQFRLVCKSWYHFITPLLYSTFTLPTHPYDKLERVSKGLGFYPELVVHLVLEGHAGDGSEQRAAELSTSCLSQCANIHTLEILDAHRIFRGSSKAKCSAIFRALPPTAPLNRLVFRFLHPHETRIYAISLTLLGLGPLFQQLTTLEIYHPPTWLPPPENVSWDLPSSFPNLQTLVVRSTMPYGRSLPKLASRIFSKSESANPGSNRHERTVPLRDLTLSWDMSTRGANIISTLLETKKLGQALTTLRIDTDAIYMYQEDSRPPLPSKIIAACPHLRTFIYFVNCPDTIVVQLPRSLEVFGILVNNWASAWDSVNLMSVENYGPLVKWLETNGKGLKKLILRFSEVSRRHVMQEISRACDAGNVELSLDCST